MTTAGSPKLEKLAQAADVSKEANKAARERLLIANAIIVLRKRGRA